MKNRPLRLYGLTLRLEGAPAEQMLNSLAAAGIKFSHPVRGERELTLRVSQRRAKLVLKLCRDMGYSCQNMGSGVATAAARRMIAIPIATAEPCEISKPESISIE